MSIRIGVGIGLAGVGFLLLCLFHGVAINLAVFTYAMLALLLALVVIGPSRIAAALAGTPGEFAFALAWLVALVLSFVFTLSKDGSFVPTLVLAVPVIGYVLGRALLEHARVLFGVVSAIVFLFAGWSTANLLISGDLAHFSMTDKNNYGALMYLVAIPWIHRYLLVCWRGERTSRMLHAAALPGMLVVFVALFGTSSRVCLLIVATAFAVWGVVALRNRLSIVPVLRCLVAAGLAFLVSSLTVELTAVGRFTEVSLGTGAGVRFALIGSALDMLDGNLATGVGVLVFPLLYRSHRTLDDLGTAGLFVHNDYVQFLVEGGLPLFLLALVFLGVAIRRGVRGVLSTMDSPGFTTLGLQLAICAAALHALLNFVYYTPGLGFLIGLMVAQSATGGSLGAMQTAPSRLSLATVAAGLALGWACCWFLAVDTMAAGVFGGQSGVPFAASYRSDPERMLGFALRAQDLNDNRGLPVLVEASLLERKATLAEGSDALVVRTLAAYERATQIDPYNGSAWLGMARFIDAHPDLQARLPADRAPEALVLASFENDPLFVEGLDWLVARYLDTGRKSDAYALLRRQILPWLRFLGREDPEAAVRYFRFLEAGAKELEDTEVLAALEQLRAG